MSQLTFYIVDVFAEEKYAGNQLAVFRGGEALATEVMQRIAKEMNYSETTFIMSETPRVRSDGFDVRIFSPDEELPFAGHPTLGTAHILRSEIISEPVEQVILNLQIGPIPVSFDKAGSRAGLYWMKQIEPTWGQTLNPEVIAPVLSLSPSDLDPRFPVEEGSTGLPFILVPLQNLEALKRAKIVREKYFELIQTTWPKGILIFCPEARSAQNQMSVRVFVEYYGIPEDPATGSGNGCLAGYLLRHHYGGRPNVDMRVEQGYEIGRPSLICLRAEEKEGHLHVWVGGQALTIAKGEFV
jgi:trans-2,3-dihydro-3-hydroxyanthranilate isomerase